MLYAEVGLSRCSIIPDKSNGYEIDSGEYNSSYHGYSIRSVNHEQYSVGMTDCVPVPDVVRPKIGAAGRVYVECI